MDAHSPRTSTTSSRPDKETISQRCRPLVLCFDGMGEQIDKNNTNISQLFAMLSKDNCNKQMVYYQTSIGTYTAKDVFGGVSSSVVQTLDSVFPETIDDHLKDAYEFLMENYYAGDKICVFGFSRGAYTARALVGMLLKVGLLPPSNIRHIGYAYKVFLQGGKADEGQARDFKECFSINVGVEFVGIWDSFGPWGVSGANISFAGHNNTIKTIRHALSLDERRALFQTNLWASTETTDTDVQEVWFAGCHSDVGGGTLSEKPEKAGRSVPPEACPSLSRISLRWMIRECFKAQTGILFSAELLHGLGMDIDLLSSLTEHTSEEKEDVFSVISPREKEEELRDALIPIKDQLKSMRHWWLLEVLPLRRRSTTDNDRQVRRIVVNLWRPRQISQQSKGTRIHRSVETKMAAGYKPKAKWEAEPSWVD